MPKKKANKQKTWYQRQEEKQCKLIKQQLKKHENEMILFDKKYLNSHRIVSTTNTEIKPENFGGTNTILKIESPLNYQKNLTETTTSKAPFNVSADQEQTTSPTERLKRCLAMLKEKPDNRQLTKIRNLLASAIHDIKEQNKSKFTR